MFGRLLSHLSHLKKNKAIPILGIKHKEVIKYVNKRYMQKDVSYIFYRRFITKM